MNVRDLAFYSLSRDYFLNIKDECGEVGIYLQCSTEAHAYGVCSGHTKSRSGLSNFWFMSSIKSGKRKASALSAQL